jgi:hypothetical protein
MKPLTITTAVSLLAAPLPAQVISEQELIAAVLIGEAGSNSNERDWKPFYNMQAVLEVIWKRHLERKQTFWEVLTQPKQFSCLNGITPQALIAKSRKHRNWLAAYYLADEMPKTRLAKGANHFHEISVHPKWARGRKPVAVIGKHKFFKL